MQQKKKTVQRDWVEQKIDQLRKKIYKSIEDLQNFDEENSVKSMDQNFQGIIMTISTLVQQIISQIFPKMAKAKQKFINRMQKLDNNLQKIEKSYLNSKGDIKKSIKVLQQIQGYSAGLQKKLQYAPCLPEITINEKKIRKAIMQNIKIQYKNQGDSDDQEDNFGNLLRNQQNDYKAEEEEQKKEIDKFDSNETFFYHPIRDTYLLMQYNINKKVQLKITTVYKFPSQFAICSVNNMMYLSGGLSNGAKACNDVYSIDAKGIVSMKMSPMIRARYRHSIAGDQKNLVATGDVGCLKQSEYYDFKKDIWGPIHNLNIGRREHASVIFTNGIYVFSGYSSHGFEHTIQFTKSIKSPWKVIDGNFNNCNNLTAIKMSERYVLILGRNDEQITTYYVNNLGEINRSFKQRINFHTAPDYGGAFRNGKVYMFSQSVYFWNEVSKKWF